MSGNGDAAIGFFILITVLAVMFAMSQAKVDRIREEGRKRIADREADFQKRMDEFGAKNPTAACSNCSYMENGVCRLSIRPPRRFCLTWISSPDHDEALRMAAKTDEQIVAEIGKIHDLADAIKQGEGYFYSGAYNGDRILRMQVERFLRLARQELARAQTGAAP